ncbi:MAG: hypothetical protein JWR77_39 [Rhizorhabdus sp.]|nr:hypothetical protein [Rhizorhabdus sp.]
MSISPLQRFSSPIFITLLSISAGVVAGTTTVHGMSPQGYGPGGSVIQRDSGAAAPSLAADSCDSCSEHDLGYHWASVQQLGSVADCPDDSWDFRRGCVAYMRDTGGV